MVCVGSHKTVSNLFSVFGALSVIFRRFVSLLLFIFNYLKCALDATFYYFPLVVTLTFFYFQMISFFSSGVVKSGSGKF